MLGRFLRDVQVVRMLPTRVRRETGSAWVDRVLREQRKGEGVTFAVLVADCSEVAGQVRFVNWSRAEKRAEVGCWLGRTYWGRGIASESLRLLCGFGFDHLELHRIEATVVEGNRRSLRMLESAGFRLEGRSRSAAWVGGRWVDELTLGLLQGELRPVSTRHAGPRGP
ncbi:MAG: GNAT family N-acetyltransferase [Thermoplasmata archaeon]|nr:GNAT family N-acetyltransferase [Thermoplasmata archaeon]